MRGRRAGERRHKKFHLGFWRGCEKQAGADSTPFYWGLKWPEVQMSLREGLDVLDVLAFWGVPTCRDAARSVLEVSADDLLSVWLRCLHSFDADKAKLSAPAIDLSRPVLSMAKEGKELELKAFGDPGEFVPTKCSDGRVVTCHQTGD